MSQRRQGTVQMTAIVAAIALVAMLMTLGSTKGGFGGSFSFDDGQVTSGVVDITAGETSRDLDFSMMLPGDVRMLQLQLRNTGTLPLRLSVGFQHDGSLLGRAIESTTWAATTCTAAPDTATWLQSQSIGSALNPTLRNASGSDRLGPEDSTVFCAALRLPLSAPNELQGTSATLTMIVDAVHDVAAASSIP